MLPLELVWHVKNLSTKPASLTTEQQDSFGDQSLLVLSTGSPRAPLCYSINTPKSSIGPCGWGIHSAALSPSCLCSPKTATCTLGTLLLEKGQPLSLCHPSCGSAVTQGLPRVQQSLVPRGVIVWSQLGNFLSPACPSWLTWLWCWCWGQSSSAWDISAPRGWGPLSLSLCLSPCCPCSTATGASCTQDAVPGLVGGLPDGCQH